MAGSIMLIKSPRMCYDLASKVSLLIKVVKGHQNWEWEQPTCHKYVISDLFCATPPFYRKEMEAHQTFGNFTTFFQELIAEAKNPQHSPHKQASKQTTTNTVI